MNKKLNKIAAAVAGYLYATGLAPGAIILEADDAGLAALPEFQRGWYVKDTISGKHKLDPSKVEVEDVTALKSTAQKEREARIAAEKKNKADVDAALAPFAGLDPVKTKEMMSKFNDADEAALIAAGKIDEVVSRRTKKYTEEVDKRVLEAQQQRDGAMEVASTFMERVLDNEIKSVCIGVTNEHVIKNGDVMREAREIFSLDDEGNAVQFEEDGETIVMGKDGKTPFSVKEWLESKRATAPHWFPADGSGGGSGGSGGHKGAGPDMTGWTSQQKLDWSRKNPQAAK